NTRARNLKVLALRKLNHAAEAGALPGETLALDPLDWWARHLNGEPLTCDLQTQLDLALDYSHAGFYAEAVELLSASGARALGRLSAPAAIGHRSGVNAALPDQSWGAAPLVQYTL